MSATCTQRVRSIADGSERLCGEPATYSFMWPGKDEQMLACERHGKLAYNVARSLGFTLPLRWLLGEEPTLTEPEIERCVAEVGAQMVADLQANPTGKETLLLMVRDAVRFGVAEECARAMPGKGADMIEDARQLGNRLARRMIEAKEARNN